MKPIPLPDGIAKFLAEQPMNAELAELRAGIDLPAVEIKVQTGGHRYRETRPLVRSEKAALREFRQSDAWPAVEQLVKNCVQDRIQAATILSQDDPLNKSDDIARAWAYVRMFKELWFDLSSKIEAASNEVEATDES